MKDEIRKLLKRTLENSDISPTHKLVNDLIERVAEAVMQVRGNYLLDDNYPYGLEAIDVAHLLSHHATRCS